MIDTIPIWFAAPSIALLWALWIALKIRDIHAG